MNTRFYDFVNEEFQFKSSDLYDKREKGKIYDPLLSKLRYILHYPILKIIEKKVQNLSDDEKLNYIAEISNLLKIDMNMLYVFFVVSYMYSSINKEYRLLAKNIYKKIKKEYTEKYLKDMELIDPLGEEQWEDDTLSKSNNIRYRSKRRIDKDFENFPIIGLHDNADKQ
jgi:hypothetical protein